MLKSISPKSALLREYIDLFYVISHTDDNSISYVAFPHINYAISFFKDVEISRSNHQINIATKPKSENLFSVEILGKFTRPVLVNFSGPVEEIAIIFKPFGVNHFLRQNLADLAPEYSQSLSLSMWTGIAPVLFAQKNINLRIEVLEQFLLENVQIIENPQLHLAIQLLEEIDKDYTIQQIADLIGMNVKTFQRHFFKHMVCSPSEYKRIFRFRYALKSKLFDKAHKTLTSLSYESSYYDQSYLIREFKKLTHQNPSTFFEEITLLDKEKIAWKIK